MKNYIELLKVLRDVLMNMPFKKFSIISFWICGYMVCIGYLIKAVVPLIHLWMQ